MAGTVAMHELALGLAREQMECEGYIVHFAHMYFRCIVLRFQAPTETDPHNFYFINKK